MRLIDADCLNFEGQNYNKSQMKAILDFVDAQPTAYDKDKVIEQLEKEKYTTTDTVCGGIFKAIRLSSAIEIVKGGGVNDEN